jgi:hypothetical protein
MLKTFRLTQASRALPLQKNDARHVMYFVQRDELSCRAK